MKLSVKPVIGFYLIFLLGLLTGACGPCYGQTLWQKRDHQKVFLFQDLKARGVGDVLTILISENTDVDNSDSRGLSKDSAAAASGNFSYEGYGATGSTTAQFGHNSNRQFNGNANFTSEREFSDRVSVTVIDVLPNGNLLVSGSRKMMVEGDLKLLTLSGIVRGHDIRADNSVFSRHVSNLSIQFEGQGPESKFTNQGWFSKRLNKFWPF